MSLFPACYPPSTQVSFQHPVLGLVEGIITNAFMKNEKLCYLIDVQSQDGITKFVIDSAEIRKL